MSQKNFLCMLVVLLSLSFFQLGPSQIPHTQTHVVIGWNDLGMHCMNGDFSAIAVLPPYNNIWAQVIERGDPPHLVASGVTVGYRFPANTTSSDKVNFWQYEDQIFGVNLANDVGLTGNGLSGNLAYNGTAFEATGVPITPFDDAAPTVSQPYQLAELTLRRSSDNQMLDQTTIVAPVSTEMHCDKCHHEDDMTTDDVILTKHDEEHHGGLLDKKPVLCAECHSSNALGTAGQPGVPSLSEALHGFHAGHAPSIGCYDCHPGPQTQCLRDAMFKAGETCQDCHGSMFQVAQSIRDGRRPWLDEPTCASCHPDHPENTGQLYRNSIGHGGMYCTACHNSPHAVLPTVQARDGLQSQRLQGEVASLGDCLVCHTSAPDGPGPHGLTYETKVDWNLWESLP